MDKAALSLSLQLALWSVILLLPAAVWVGRALAWGRMRWRGLVGALVALPLVLPPTVLGFYLLQAFGGLGPAWSALFGHGLAFSFEGLLIASLIANLPFAIQPAERAFAAIPREVREAAWCSGLSAWQTFLRIELPLAWPGLLTAGVLVFAHTLGEFGVVLMVGGNVAGETRTLSIAIYDRVQAFDDAAAGAMAAALLALSLAAILLVQRLTRHVGQTRD
ncbi:MAG: molybdate ABC transporter permease subunit [Alphaproteobacteria bacterium]|nr:molybdate ABC transporter permease subunit [Alphaproteobacteria bacterium]